MKKDKKKKCSGLFLLILISCSMNIGILFSNNYSYVIHVAYFGGAIVGFIIGAIVMGLTFFRERRER